jgi:RHS repeat-associated protein
VKPFARASENMGRIIASGFTGAYQDSVTFGYPLGNGYRWYLPSLMRFNAPDVDSPFGVGGFNPYAYCGNDPANRSDPSGHAPPFAAIEIVSELVDRGIAQGTQEAAASLAAREAESAAEHGLKNVISASHGGGGGRILRRSKATKRSAPYRVRFSEVVGQRADWDGWTKEDRGGATRNHGSWARGILQDLRADPIPEEAGIEDYLKMAEGRLSDAEGALGILANLSLSRSQYRADAIGNKHGVVISHSGEERMRRVEQSIEGYTIAAQTHLNLASQYRTQARGLMTGAPAAHLRLDIIDSRYQALSDRLLPFFQRHPDLQPG